MGIIAIAFLPDRPEMTKFFDEDERQIAIARMNRGISGDNGLILNKGITMCLCLEITQLRIYI